MTTNTETPTDTATALPEDADQLTAKLRRAAVAALPPERLLPDRQPAYVASWIYVFGVLTLSALAVVILTGVVSFIVSVGAAFTGYLSQQNFDSQWISTQAKDGINSTGAGAIFNVTNFGQMLMWHIVLLPLIVALLVGGHVLLVRLRGVVPPFAPTDHTAKATEADQASPQEIMVKGDLS